MSMFRLLFLAAAYLAVLVVRPSASILPDRLPLSKDQQAIALRALKWFLALCSLHEVNAALNRWAENKWLWTEDKTPWSSRDEIAVVTGGSQGIGGSIVKKLAVSHGIKVAVLDIEPLSEDLQRGMSRVHVTQPSCGSMLMRGVEETDMITFYKCDITSREQVHKAGEAIRSDLGFPTILINNAGVGNANSILEVSQERLRTIFDVNLLSQWNTVQEFLPAMLERKKGHIMSTASLASFAGLAGMVDYSCTKAGLMAFHEGLRQELKHRYGCPQIKTSIVYPNWTKTRLTALVEKGIQSVKIPIAGCEDVAEIMVKQIVAKRSGQIILANSLVASLRAFPTWLQELLRDQLAQVVTINATTAVAQSQ